MKLGGSMPPGPLNPARDLDAGCIAPRVPMPVGMAPQDFGVASVADSHYYLAECQRRNCQQAKNGPWQQDQADRTTEGVDRRRDDRDRDHGNQEVDAVLQG